MSIDGAIVVLSSGVTSFQTVLKVGNLMPNKPDFHPVKTRLGTLMAGIVIETSLVLMSLGI